ncbi:DUF2625 family protein [Streptomyces sp. NPDC047841]|uniref:DUF2625 family protein n=1 Tax=Streptomyces sp. NPDC047841 TaxID=3154708 RepID=UPI0034530AD9
MREIDELSDVADPAWPKLEQAFAGSAVPVRVLPADPAEGRRCLLRTRVTTRPVPGALILHCGGLVPDDGRLRVYGAGSAGAGCRASAGSTAPRGAGPPLAPGGRARRRP